MLNETSETAVLNLFSDLPVIPEPTAKELQQEKERRLSVMTPGPWFFEGRRGLNNELCHYAIGPKQENGKPYKPTVASTWAVANLGNARVLAAAPELLEVLELIVACDIQWMPGGGLIDQAKAAIAKARGTNNSSEIPEQ